MADGNPGPAGAPNQGPLLWPTAPGVPGVSDERFAAFYEQLDDYAPTARGRGEGRGGGERTSGALSHSRGRRCPTG